MRWWTAFVSYQPPIDSPTIPPTPVQTTLKNDYVEEENQSMISKHDTQLNASRLSCAGSSSTSWNELWQSLCDEVSDCMNDSSNFIPISTSACQYADRIVTETYGMNEKVLKHFLCPDSLKSQLQDGFYDKDGCYFSESGSLFVIPLHVMIYIRFYYRLLILFEQSMNTWQQA